jgi:uncharacterized phage-associated protein
MVSDRLNAQDVADYFLANVDEDSGDNISNLKLQKLLYYAQGFHLAMQGKSLFTDSILAWKHGPVVRPIWLKYKPCGFNAIARPKKYDPHDYAPEVREVLDAVYATYGQFTAKRLEQMTHEEPPWQKTRRNSTISVVLLQDYFSELVQAGTEGRAIEGRPQWPTRTFHFQRRKAISERMDVHREKLRAIAASKQSRAR